MTFSYFKVIRVMCRSDLYNAGTKFHIYIGIRNDRNLTVYNRQQNLSANQMLITLVGRVNCNRTVAQHGFRTGGRKFQKFCRAYLSIFIDQRIFDMPEMTSLLFVYNLCIRNRSFADRTPVADSVSFINPAFFVHAAEYFRNSLITAFVHRETESVPVTGGSQLL